MSFTHNKAKPLTATFFYYKSNNYYQRIAYGHTTESDLREQSIESDAGNTFTDPANWQNYYTNYTSTPDMTKYIGAIGFYIDAINPPNGGADGDLTLQEALDAVYAYFTSTQAMPASLIVDGNAIITIDAATAVH